MTKPKQNSAAGSASSSTAGLEHKSEGWQCDLGNGEFDHDWEWRSDWYGDPGVINGTADCSAWHCRVCGAVDAKRDPPTFDDDVL
jgi:hypothetical protein